MARRLPLSQAGADERTVAGPRQGAGEHRLSHARGPADQDTAVAVLPAKPAAHVLMQIARERFTPYPSLSQSMQVGEASFRRGSPGRALDQRSEEHTSELQSLMRISYAVFCLNKKKRRIH